MKFLIDENYRIRSDSRQWMIDKKRSRKGKENWQPTHYFSTFHRCVQRLGEMLCRELDTEGVAEALTGIDEVSTKLSRALSPDFRVVKAGELEDDGCYQFGKKTALPASPTPHQTDA